MKESFDKSYISGQSQGEWLFSPCNTTFGSLRESDENSSFGIRLPFCIHHNTLFYMIPLQVELKHTGGGNEKLHKTPSRFDNLKYTFTVNSGSRKYIRVTFSQQ